MAKLEKKEKEERCSRSGGTMPRAIYFQQHHYQLDQQQRSGDFMVISW